MTGMAMPGMGKAGLTEEVALKKFEKIERRFDEDGVAYTKAEFFEVGVLANDHFNTMILLSRT